MTLTFRVSWRHGGVASAERAGSARVLRARRCGVPWVLVLYRICVSKSSVCGFHGFSRGRFSCTLGSRWVPPDHHLTLAEVLPAAGWRAAGAAQYRAGLGRVETCSCMVCSVPRLRCRSVRGLPSFGFASRASFSQVRSRAFPPNHPPPYEGMENII